VEARFSAPFQTGPGAQPASYTMGTGSFQGVKWPGRGVDHSAHLAPRLKKEQSYITTPPLDLRGLLQGELNLYLYPFIRLHGVTHYIALPFPHSLQPTYTIEQILSSASDRNEILSSLRQKQHFPPKLQHQPAKLHNVKIQMTTSEQSPLQKSEN